MNKKKKVIKSSRKIVNKKSAVLTKKKSVSNKKKLVKKKKASTIKKNNVSAKVKKSPKIRKKEDAKPVKKNIKIKQKINPKENKKRGFFSRFFRKKDIPTKKTIKPKKIVPSTKNTNMREEFVKTGISGLDALFDKNMGIPNGASVLIEGGPGSGKTIFCLATLNELCKKGKKCLYMSFEESEEQLIDHMEKFNWEAKKYIKNGLLRISRFDAIDISRSIEALLSAAKKELLIEVDPIFFPDDFAPDFVVIDSLTSIASAFTGEESRFRIYMEQLFRYLEKNKITNFLIREVSSPSHVGTTFKEAGEAVSFLSDGIIVIYNVIYDSGKRGSAIEILKMRGSSFQKKLVELKVINRKGVLVNPNKIIKKGKKTDFKLT